MKCILIVYLFLQIAGTYYLFTQLEEGFTRHLILTVPAILLYMAACIKDPGYAKFSSIKFAQSDTQIGTEQCQSTIDTKQEIVQTIEKKQCKVCKETQLVRMKHCYDCNLCVATFDHHCIWIDNCVGQKNRHVFYLCVVTNLVAVGDAFLQMVVGMWEKGQKQALQIAFLSFLGIIVIGLVLLTCMHSYLMCTNLTTWEITRWQKINYLSGRSRSQSSPFSEGIVKNIVDYWLCGVSKGYKKWNPKGISTLSEQ